jgi:hypothetical protein
MNAQEYDSFLIETASKIDTLIAQKSKRQHFQKQVNLFLDGFDKWYEAFKDGIEQAKKNPKLFAGKMPVDDGTEGFLDNDTDGKWLESAKKNCPAGYELVYPHDDYYPYNKRIEPPAGYYYRKPLPLNPLDTLIPKDDFENLFPNQNREIPMIERRPIDGQEDLLRKYYLLALIHANKGNSTALIDKNGYSADLVWSVYGSMDIKNKWHFWGKYILALIEAAFQSVKAGLEIICTPDKKISKKVLNIPAVVVGKAKRSNTEQNGSEEIILTEKQKKILKYLNKEKIAVAMIDIETGTSLSKNTVSDEIAILKKCDYVALPTGKKRLVGITSKGIGYLKTAQ